MAALTPLQNERLNRLLDALLPANRFFAKKFADSGLGRADIRTAADLKRLRFTTKAELVADQQAHPPYGSGLTFPLEAYTRLHQTSGTQGSPLRWLDTPESWENLKQSWCRIFEVVGVQPGKDRLLFAFSFGPFLGFWTAFEAAEGIGCMRLAAGGMSSLARLRLLLDTGATLLLCTPTYALHLAQVAAENGIVLRKSTPGYALRALIVAGEPGGSIPETKARIEEAWHARVFDHHGMTEIGPMTIECPEVPGGLHILEEDYLTEVIDPATGAEVPPGQVGELVVTNLCRVGNPLLRYRTGDLVRFARKPCPCGRPYARLEGGILGRTDDMISIRGNNFYPTALEGVIRRFKEVAEYRVEIDTSAPLAELRVEIEPSPGHDATLAERIAQSIRDDLLFRAEVVVVPAGTLPRFEMKAQRIKRKPV